MEENQTKIEFTAEDGSTISFFVLEQVKIAGIDYILVTDSEDEEAEAYILKEICEEDGQSVYEFLEDEEEMLAISKVFEETLEDIDIEMEE